MFCRICGNKLNDGAVFCTACGSRVVAPEKAAASVEDFDYTPAENAGAMPEIIPEQQGCSAETAAFTGYESVQEEISADETVVLPDIEYIETEQLDEYANAAGEDRREASSQRSNGYETAVGMPAYGQEHEDTVYAKPQSQQVYMYNGSRHESQQVNNRASRHAAHESEPPDGSGKKKVIILAAAALVLVAAVVAVLFIFVFNNKEKIQISLSKFVSAEVSGEDGRGELNAYFDYDGLKEALEDAVLSGGEGMTALSADDMDKIDEICDEVYASFSQKNKLSNGDTVEITLSAPKDAADDLGIEFIDTEYSFKVRGLGEEAAATSAPENNGIGKAVETEEAAGTGEKKLKEFDAFAYIELEVKGYSPFLELTAVNSRNEEPYSLYTCELSKATGVANGDVITVSINDAAVALLAEHGYSPVATSMEYTVTGAGGYVTDISGLTEATLSAMNAAGKQEIARTFQGDATYTLTDAAWIGTAFASGELESVIPVNSSIMLYNVLLTTADGPIQTYYWVAFDDTRIDADGRVSVAFDALRTMNDDTLEISYMDPLTTSTGKYGLNGYATIEKLKSFLETAYAGYSVSYNVTDIAPRDLSAYGTLGAGHLTDDPNGYILPDSDKIYYSREFLATLTDEELRFARNEICARLGRMYESPELSEYFSNKNWYVPQYPADVFDNIDNRFNVYEKANLDLINDIEAKREQGLEKQETTAAQ